MHTCPTCGTLCQCDDTDELYDDFPECTHQLKEECIEIEEDPDETPIDMPMGNKSPWTDEPGDGW